MFQRQFQIILSAGADRPLLIMIIIKLLFVQRYTGGKSEEFMGNTEYIHDSKVFFSFQLQKKK